MPGATEQRVSRFALLYKRLILCHPRAVVFLFCGALLFFGYHLGHFRMDAASDSLVLENDSDLRYYEATREIFGSDDYIILALTSGSSVLSDSTFSVLQRLSAELQRLPRVESVNSILTVPLFKSPRVPLYEMGSRYKTLLMEDCDRELAAAELTHSPLWRNNLISADGRTTSIVITFIADPEYTDLGNERSRLRRLRDQGSMARADQQKLTEVSLRYSERHL